MKNVIPMRKGVRPVELSDEQREAFELITRRKRETVTIEARAGSGKTRVVVTAVAHLVLQDGVNPAKVTVTTFTRAAAQEIQQRVEVLTGPLPTLQVGTMHALALRWLRKKRLINPKRIMNIADARSSTPTPMGLLYAVSGWGTVPGTNLRGLDLDLSEEAAHEVFTFMERHRAHGRTWTDPRVCEEAQADEVTRYAPRVWEAFDAAKTRLGVYDFEDLIVLAKEAAEAGQIPTPWFLLVDEAQDTNATQHAFIAATGKGKIALIGDPWQSIYGFRGTTPQYFMQQCEDHDSAALTTNYRSSSDIVRFSALVSQTVVQEGPKAAPGQRVYPGERVGPFIQRQLDRKGVAPEDVAVLCRSAEEIARVQIELGRLEIPNKATSQGFWNSKLVRVVTGYAAFAAGAGTFNALYALLNTPKRYLSRSWATQVAADAKSIGWVASLARNSTRGLGPGQLAQARELARLLGAIASLPWSKACDEVQTALLRYTHDNPEIVKGWRARVSFVLGLMREADSASGWCDLVDEQRRKPVIKGKSVPGFVTVSTIHRSKGLEWPIVVVCCDDSVLPHNRSKSDEELAEEHRLFYVACTRAEQHLALSWEQTPSRYVPSSYLTGATYEQDDDDDDDDDEEDEEDFFDPDYEAPSRESVDDDGNVVYIFRGDD